MLRRLAAGEPTPAIARALGLSIKTVECHVSRILAAVGMPTRRDVIAWARAWRVFDAE